MPKKTYSPRFNSGCRPNRLAADVGEFVFRKSEQLYPELQRPYSRSDSSLVERLHVAIHAQLRSRVQDSSAIAALADILVFEQRLHDFIAHIGPTGTKVNK